MKPLVFAGLFSLFFASAHLLKQNENRPRVVMVSPDRRAVGVPPGASVTAYASVPTNGGIDNRTISPSHVKLYQVSGTGGGDAIILTPQSSLLPNTTYRFVATRRGAGKFSCLSFNLVLPMTIFRPE